MEKNKEILRKEGLGVCAISYDSQEILKAFAERRQISIPLLSDPDSKIIRAFGILNSTIPPDQMAFGIPYPGSYLVDEKGKVRAKYFEEDFRDRYSTGTILVHELGSALNTKQTTLEQEHLSIKYFASTEVCSPGSRISLLVEIQLKDKVHLYAPGAQGYVPLELTLKPSAAVTLHALSYPPSHSLFLPAIKETVPVYEGIIRLVQDVTITANPPALTNALNPGGELFIDGNLQYQACDDKMCYLPQSKPIRWVVKIQELDRERAPEPLRHGSQIRTSFNGEALNSHANKPGPAN